MACACLNTLFGIFDFDIGLCHVKAEEKIVQPCSRRQTVSTFSTFQHLSAWKAKEQTTEVQWPADVFLAR